MEDKEIRKRRRVPCWLKWIIGIFVGLILVVAGLITGVVILLKPDKLASLVETYAPEYIDGNVKVSSIELTFWHTFPRLTVEIDSLILTSNVLKSLDESVRKSLPSYCDTLIQFSKFKGNINIEKLFENRLEIYDVELQGPTANIVTVNDSIANYDIFIASDDEESTGFNSISIESFRIINSGPIRLYSYPDSSYYSVTLNEINVDGTGCPVYALSTSGKARATLLDAFNINSLRFAFDGAVNYDFNKGLSELNVRTLFLDADTTVSNVSASILFGDTLKIMSLSVDVPSIKYSAITRFFPELAAGELRTLDTNADISLHISLTDPYIYSPSSPAIPSAIIDIEVPSCYVRMPSHKLNINKFLMQAKVSIDGKTLNNSKLEIPRLLIDGNAIDIDMRGMVTSPIADPLIAGEIKGRVFIDRLPDVAKENIPGNLKGIVGLNTAFRLRQSQLTPTAFHKIFLKGTVSLRDMDYELAHIDSTGTVADTLKFYTPLAMLRFDSDKSYEGNDVKVDSLLSLTFTSDSIYYFDEGMDIRVATIEAALGMRNVSESADTTKINPIGGKITIDKLRLRSDVDSTRLSLTKLECNGSLTRFHGLGRVPLLNLSATAKRISAGTPDARISVGKPSFNLTANMNPRRRNGRLGMSEGLADSVGHIDTIKRHQGHHINTASHERSSEDSITSGIRQLLRRWNIRGEFTAGRARLFTPTFPLNNTMRNIDMSFTTDSIDLRSVKLRAGRSDFDIKGTISGLRRAMSRRKKQPLRIEFFMQSDTIDVDELSRAVFAGAGAEHDNALWTATTDETTDVADVINVDTTITAPFIVPDAIDATLKFRSRNVLYTGMLLNSFRGELEVWDQAIHLHGLQAQSPMGDIALSALYNAPSADDLEFGMGMQLSDFHIKKLKEVTPAINELLPAIQDFSGVINADVAMTTRLDKEMNFIIPSVQADIKIDGDSLVLLDADTFKSLSKWLLFKDKKRNMIDHMSVQVQIDSSQLILYPFIFNIDRYKLGIMGSNDLDMNLNYHVSVLKSPIPFKFGINITGNFDKMKIRLGGAKIKENTVVERMAINSDTRINLVNQLEGVFRRGANSGADNKVRVHNHSDEMEQLKKDLTIEPSDTLDVKQKNMLDKSL